MRKDHCLRSSSIGFVTFLLWVAAGIFPYTLSTTDVDQLLSFCGQGTININLNSSPVIYRHPHDHTNNSVGVANIPIRYDGAQLWRIYNTSKKNWTSRNNLDLSDILELLFDAVVWKQNHLYTDVSINKCNLEAAMKYLEALNLYPKILHENVQDMIEYNSKQHDIQKFNHLNSTNDAFNRLSKLVKPPVIIPILISSILIFAI